MRIYVTTGLIEERDAFEQLKNEQNMKPNMPDRGKALEAAPEKPVSTVSVDREPSARVEDVVEAPMSEPGPQVTQDPEPETALVEETVVEPTNDTIVEPVVEEEPPAEEPAVVEKKAEEKTTKKSKAKKSKTK